MAEPSARKRAKTDLYFKVDIDEREWHRLWLLFPETDFVIAGKDFDSLMRDDPIIRESYPTRVYSETEPDRLGIFTNLDSCYSSATSIENPRIAWMLQALGVDLLRLYGFQSWRDVHTYGSILVTGPDKRGLTVDELEALRTVLKAFHYSKDPQPIKF